ncbi:hypothetical protein [Lachnotalea sp. AF33-28]|uniref:hypothetical protein n=1 Tax=Lachnotalea sp. AF33-28 TaxID=2292046 RepID=UPI000E510AAB|nr:hypothetical protein [Lachnotalea sp. AF33-28]RHP33911.1 hypothetical protein DWZ56_08555 [Lachnotalea sp. AF33-28]
MSEYQRFVSYIYAYNGEVKNKNVGFAKVEARNGQCKLLISLKGAYGSAAGPLMVCGFCRDKENIKKIPLGQVLLRSGMGEFRYEGKENDMGGSGVGLSGMNGLVIKSAGVTKTMYITAWDDKPIWTSKFQDEPALAGGRPDRGERPHTTPGQGFLRAAEVSAAETVLQEPESVETVQSSTNRDSKIRILFPAEEPPVELIRTEEPAEGAVKDVESVYGYESGVRLEPETVTASDPVELGVEEEIRTAFEQKQAPGAAASGQEESETADYIQEEASGTSDRKIVEEIRSDADGAPETDRNDAAANTDGIKHGEIRFGAGRSESGDAMWNRLAKRFPKRAIRSDAGVWEVMQIQPQDIGLLPRETWIFGNNSFLLHGYYQYRHLILARLGGTCILGVPGLNHNSEKFMAAMFGFENYLPAGEYGYWYTEIKLGNN